MQHFYRFYQFFGEEKRQGEESIVLSWSGFCGQESLYLKFTFMFLCEIFKFLFSFICREMSSDDEEVGKWWMYFHFSVLLNFILSICCLLFYRNHYRQKFLKLSRLTLKVSDDIMLLFNICRQQDDGKVRVQSLLRISKMSVKWHVHVPPASLYPLSGAPNQDIVQNHVI